jgi:DNA-binding NarL/FixJ family response regulator
MAAIRLLIVDDHPVVRAGLRTIAEMDPGISIVGEAASGKEALLLARSSQPQVALLDIRLPNESGVEICRHLKALLPTLRVIFLTSYAEAHLILAALEAGADGYLLKENDTRDVVQAIRTVLRGEAVFDTEVANQIAGNRPSSNAPSLDKLTPQERLLLAEVAKGKTDKEAAVALGITPKTARNYLDRVFSKLEVHTRTEAALLYIRSSEGMHR